MMERTTFTKEKPGSVSALTQQIKGALERGFPHVWISGEISNFKRASSGHWYFSLKDENASIRCNMWRSYTGSVRFQPRDGSQVLLSGALNVYQPRGEYSLMVEYMEDLGVGRLRAEFERLKAALAARGLFDPAHKKPLPLLPAKIGVVTSPTGAAIRDILQVLHSRFAGVHVLIYPARVQGAGSAEEIAAGIRYLDQHGHCDVIIAGRGGGSEEDLWAFNEEIVAQAVFACQTPIVSAVGHEIDWSIADMVADVRAATPSHAAEMVIKSRMEYTQKMALLREQLDRNLQRRIMMLRRRVNVSESHPIFIRVRSRVNDSQRRLAELDYRLAGLVGRIYRNRRERLMRADTRLQPRRLEGRLALLRARRDAADHELLRRISARLEKRAARLAAAVNRLHDLSPLKTLSRGFAAVYNHKNKVVHRPEDVQFGEVIRVQLAEGEIRARVIETQSKAVQPSLF